MKPMGWWRTLLDSLDTPGGHICVLLLLMLTAFVMMRFEWSAMKAGEIATGAFGALLGMLRLTTSNREQQGTTTIQQASSVTTPIEEKP